MLRSMRCCLNPKVLTGLGVLLLVLWLVSPRSGAASLPVLIVLVCPLSMGAMMWRMRRGGGCSAEGAAASGVAAPDNVDDELRALREEVAIARARRRLAADEDRSLG